MSRDTSSFGIVARNNLRNMRSVGNENEFENLADSFPNPPPRTPLNTIPDPSQYAIKSESSKVGELLDGNVGAFDYSLAQSKGMPNTSLSSGTHRSSARGKAHSEPNSAQSTPEKGVSRVSNNAVLGTCIGSRTLHYTGVRGGTSSRVSRGISIVPLPSSTEIPYFELLEDPSFWMDHNVQVLIRIRPPSPAERASQGSGRCLRQNDAQSLTWLGHPETRFTFDHIACETISQEELFQVVGVPMVENCMSGYNSCMFAYGQTGSGKTHTMMGEIFEMDGKLNESCGLTPRIFEYLFTRIKAEEENRRDEKLKYSCKCSFLEIYNEQITDLLETSSINLQLREDMKKGVYVENLMEHEVSNVRDVVELLIRGAANRKMAATHMNSESSRSHSVFTCIIESRWDKDSINHLRFARLNLVDLAGSERQKSSGAEGERLKEAANINKSLSTLGLVIMTLVDVAQGKHRHIPYRDSRLTFLLQDSLGGNSKTTIIANVSPSICSANETLSTLKFAQRAKLIQNNAKVNEDASGDVVALQREVQQLKGQLTILLKHHNLSSSSLLSCPGSEQSKSEDCHEDCEYSPDGRLLDDKKNRGLPESKIKCLEVALVGALRREEKAEAAVRKLEAEVERMNCLMQQREEDAQRTKLMLELTKEKIKRLELLADGLVSGEHYLMEENNDLSKEILLLRSKIDRNPELTQLALENMRLLDHLRVLEDFHKQGERETLLAEVSEMRYQLLEALERNHEPLPLYHKRVVQDTETLKDLEECKKNLSASIKCNAELTSRVDELQKELKEYIECTNAACHSVADSLCGEGSIKHRNKYSTILHFKLSNPSLVTQEGNSVNSFFNKCEEAQATMKEADAMLNALLKANETAKHMTHDWKQAGEMLMIERATLVEEVRQLKASLYLKEEEYEFMRDQICSSLVDVTNSLSLLEGSFFQMQRDVEDWLKVIFSDIFSLRQDIWAHLHNSRSSLEDIWSSMMEYDIAFFVLYECYAGKRIAKVPIFKVDCSPFQNRQKECSSTSNNLDIKCMNTRENGCVVKGMFHLEGILERSQNKNPQEENSKPVNVQCTNYSCRAVAKLKEDELSESFDSLISENFSLKKELSRKDVILKGLLFDLSLLQESAASANDKKTEMEQFGEILAFVQHELAVKTNQLDDTLIQHKKLRMELDDCVAALTISNSELEHVQATVNTLANQNTELRNLLEDLRVRKNSADQQLEETNEVVKCLEEEIIRLASSVEEKNLTSIEDIEDDLRRVSVERDCLYEEVISLNRKLEMANALAEENEAIAIEARQESEASKIYAEQKQEEVKILENSVGELECTVDVLEKKVYEMGKEVEGHRRMRDCLEVELQALRQRMLTVETAAENMDSGTSNVEDHEEDQTSKHIDNGVFERIRFLEMEKADHAEEIKQCKEYISELLLHAEAQAKQYQQKYKALEDMVRELKSDPSTSTSAAALTLDKSEKPATRSRGSSSPFRCIASLVQQMNSEKDQELSMAKLRIEDLEALAAKRHKEVCVLSARLSAAENMTHDVIRDLLGVKLDITNYANLIEQDQIQKLLEEALRQTEESVVMEQEIIKLRRKINDLTVESESFVEEIKAREADILAAQLTVEQLHQRDQLLAAQNKMLEMENISLKRRSADLDEMLKEVLGSQNVHQYIPQPPKEQNPSRAGNRERCKRLAYSQKLPSHLNDELARYSKSNNINSKGDELRQRIRRQESKD